MNDRDYWAMFAAGCMAGGAHILNAYGMADKLLAQLKARFPDPQPVTAEPVTHLLWHDWEGGERPVNSHAEVCAQLRDGNFYQRRADRIEWSWDDEPYPGDVVSYMVLKP